MSRRQDLRSKKQEKEKNKYFLFKQHGSGGETAGAFYYGKIFAGIINTLANVDPHDILQK